MIPASEVFSCQATDDLRTISHLWEAGESRDLVLSIDKTRSGTRIGESSTLARLTVQSVGETGTVFEWENGSTDLSSLELPADVAEDLAPILVDSPIATIRYRTDVDGYFAGVEDPVEFRANVLELVDRMSEVVPDLSMDKVATAYETASDEVLVNMFTEVQQLFHALDESYFFPGDSETVVDVLPNGLGGEPFPAITAFAVGFEPDANGCLAVSLVTEIDSEKFTDILFASVAQFFDEDPAEIPDDELEELRAQLSVKIEMDARIDPTTGRVKSIRSTTTVGDPDGSDSAIEINEVIDVTPVSGS